MYHTNKPNIHDIVFVQLTSEKSDNIGNYVNLVEYDNLSGLVLCTEITKFKSKLKTLVKRDEIFPVVVISTSHGYDLSYSKIKKLSQNLLKECYDYQNNISYLIKTISSDLNLDENIKNNLIKYNLNPNIYNESVNTNKNLCLENYNSFLTDSDILFDKFDTDSQIKNDFKLILQKRLTIKPYVIHQEFKLLIYDNNSLNILKTILEKIKLINIDTKFNYQLECKSSPIYLYKLSYNNLTDIIEKIKEINENINTICKNYNCKININLDYIVIKKGELIFN